MGGTRVRMGTRKRPPTAKMSLKRKRKRAAPGGRGPKVHHRARGRGPKVHRLARGRGPGTNAEGRGHEVVIAAAGKGQSHGTDTAGPGRRTRAAGTNADP